MNNITSLLDKINMELETSMIEDRAVNVHFLGGLTIRNSIIPQEIEVDENGIYIESDNFMLDISNENIKEIEYDEIGNSYHINTGVSEAYLDFYPFHLSMA